MNVVGAGLRLWVLVSPIFYFARSEHGHAGIVQTVSACMISTIEANTSLDSATPAKDREGDWITTKLFSRYGRGRLRTLGFITPEAVTMLLNAER